MRAVAGRVIVAVAPEDVDHASERCGSEVVVVAGGRTRQETMRAAFEATRAPMVVLHDVVHPFVTPALAREVIDVARTRGAALAAVASASAAVGHAQGKMPTRFGPGEVQLVRRPVAFRRADFARGLEAGGDGDTVGIILERASVQIEFVAAPSWNIKVTTPDDWALARAIEAGLRPV